MTEFTTFFTEGQKAVEEYTMEELRSGLAIAKNNLAVAQRVGAEQGTIKAMQSDIEWMKEELASRLGE